MYRPATLGELKTSGYRARSVKQELRENLIQRIGSGQTIFPGVVGYEETVLPQIVNGILSLHDLLFLGLRGQAKTRIIRALPALLDEWMPVVAGVELWDDPLQPAFKATKRKLAEHGDETELHWVHRNERYNEKLATPDVTIADLIGEIDLVKHAEGRYLADESTMHFGMIPRTNRGIFAINELPDLAPRIQVGLFNVLEERDVQIRGFPVRLELDVCMVFSANPEDYTNRGRIVTPLKDRIGTVIRTHYPATMEQAVQISRENAWLDRSKPVVIPRFMHEISEEVVRLARKSPHINQASGVSVRTSIANLEILVSNAERRSLLTNEPRIVPRCCDLDALTATCRGKIELLLGDDSSAEDKVIASLIGEAVKTVFAGYLEMDQIEPLASQFTRDMHIELGDDMPTEACLEQLGRVDGLLKIARAICKATDLAEEPGELLSAAELVLEALHVNNKLSKYAFRTRTLYRG